MVVVVMLVVMLVVMVSGRTCLVHRTDSASQPVSRPMSQSVSQSTTRRGGAGDAPWGE